MSGDELAFSSRYKLDVKLGSGGMGAVYRAYDCVLKKNVAVKLLLPSRSQQNMAVRFQQEAKTAAKLKHPNIIKVLDFGQTDKGEFYLIMDYLEGQSLEKIVDTSGPLDSYAALNIFDQICLGMEHAHSHGVLHRDVKPSNIMISEGTNHVTIVDFGVAKLLSDDMKLTSAGKPVGSPTYMSPEQAQGHDVDIRSDVYSVGCLMYMTLIGHPPFMGDTYLETIKQQIDEPAPLLNDGLDPPKFSEELEAIVEKALEKAPENRFQNFSEMHRSISSISQKPVVVSTKVTEEDAPAIPAPLNQRTSKVFRPAIIILGALSIVVTGAIAFFLVQTQDNPKVAKKETPKEFEFKHYVGTHLSSPRWLLGSGNLHRNGIKDLFKYKKTADRLVLIDPKLNDSDMRYVEELPLIALDLSNTRVTAKRLRTLSIPTLKCLILNDNPQITDDSIAYIKNLDLEVLGLRGTSVTDKGVKELATIKSLHCLDLEGLKGVTADSLPVLATLPALQCLKITGTAIGAADVKQLLNFPSLRHISFANTDATDDTFDTLFKLKPLTINLANTNITDRSLKKLQKIPYPVGLNIHGCKRVTQTQVLQLQNKFKIGEQALGRVRSDFCEPTIGFGVSEKAMHPRVTENTIWYDPKIFAKQPSPGYSHDYSNFVEGFNKRMDAHSEEMGKGQTVNSKVNSKGFNDEIDIIKKEFDRHYEHVNE